MPKRLFLLLFSFVLLTPVAYAAPGVPRAAHACRYQPGTSFTAEIHVDISDREVPSDTGTVTLNLKIPSGGRVAQAKVPRYVASLNRVGVPLTGNRVKHFDLAPSVIIENPNSADCQLKMELGVAGRSWAQQAKTHFTFSATVVVGGQRTTFKSVSAVGCVDEDTLILLADGSRVPVKQLVPGDVLRNPMTAAALEVAEVIRGTQADEVMYRIGFGGSTAVLTAWHPVMTRFGLKPARDVEPGDLVLGEDGAYHGVTLCQAFAGDPTRSVYNLRLNVGTDAGFDHLLSAGGVVTGDFFLQTLLQGRQSPAQ